MTTSWQYWTADVAKRLSEILGTDVRPTDIVTPPDRKHGDFAYGCFRLAKAMGKSPADIATEVVAKLDLKNSDFVSAVAAGPYVNISLGVGDAVHRVVREIETVGEAYGTTKTSKPQILIEYAQPNTHKEIHVGHLRAMIVGQSIVNILAADGWDVVPMSYHGDVGAHVAKCLWWIMKNGGIDSLKPEERNGMYLGKMYTESSKQLEAHPEYKDEISDVQAKLEAHDPAWEKLWQETRRWSLDEMAKIFDDLGVKVKRQYLESEVVDRGQQMVDVLLEKEVAKESQGAIIVDLEEKKLGVFLVRKSDGNSLYSTKDLALAELKFKEYPKADRSMIVVDNRQSFYFKQLFETLTMMKIGKPQEFVGFEYVTLKSGAMSSREGNIVTLESFRDEVVKYATDEIVKRHAEDSWNDGKIEHTAWCIAMAGMKFGMLRQDNDKMFTFDLEQSLSFDGDTGPYCLYAATRLASIMRKANGSNPFLVGAIHELPLARSFDHASEKALALSLAQFPLRVHQAAEESRPSIIAQWCIEVAQGVSEFYHSVSVLESEGELKEGRLRLVAAARQALVSGLGLLSIPVPDEM
ncbi:MAG: arginine--tRNA ligase [Candidatus Uhrbacteria bacterium]